MTVRSKLFLQASAWWWVVSLCGAHTLAAQDEIERAVEISGELPGCVAAESLRARIRELVGDDAWPPDLQVAVRLTAAESSFSMSKAGSLFAERRFARLPAACTEKRDALAVAIVLALENARTRKSQSESPAVTDSAPELLPAAVREPAAVSSEPVRADPHAVVQPADVAHDSVAAGLPRAAAGRATLYAGGQWLWAAAPSGAAALAAGLELSLTSAWSLSFGGLWGPRADHQLAARPERVSAQLFAGQLFGCWSTRALATFQGCGGGVAGVLDAEGHGAGFVRGERATLAWAGLTLRAALAWPATGALALRARVDGRVNLLRPVPEVPGPRGFSAPVDVLGADLGLDLLWRID